MVQEVPPLEGALAGISGGWRGLVWLCPCEASSFALFLFCLPFVLRHKNKTDKAKWELNETADKRSPAVLELRKWFMQHHEGLLPRDDDAFLLRFLRARKFDMQRTQL